MFSFHFKRNVTTQASGKHDDVINRASFSRLSCPMIVHRLYYVSTCAPYVSTVIMIMHRNKTFLMVCAGEVECKFLEQVYFPYIAKCAFLFVRDLFHERLFINNTLTLPIHTKSFILPLFYYQPRFTVYEYVFLGCT